MHALLVILALAALAGYSYLCVRYGRSEEAKTIAFALRIESYAKQEYVDVIAKIRSTAAAELARLKKFL